MNTTSKTKANGRSQRRLQLEKRQHERHELMEGFSCYWMGRKLLCLALDQGPGGAFLKTNEEIPLGAPLIIVPDKDLQGRTVHLIADVARHQEMPARGIGIRWRYAISADGEVALRMFLRDHFRLADAPVLEQTSLNTGDVPKALFDFGELGFRLVSAQRLTHLVESLLSGNSEVPESQPSHASSSEESQSEMLLINLPVLYRWGGKWEQGTVRFASRSKLVLESRHPLPAPGRKLLIAGTSNSGGSDLTLWGTALQSLVSRMGATRLELTITRGFLGENELSDPGDYVSRLGAHLENAGTA